MTIAIIIYSCSDQRGWSVYQRAPQKNRVFWTISDKPKDPGPTVNKTPSLPPLSMGRARNAIKILFGCPAAFHLGRKTNT